MEVDAGQRFSVGSGAGVVEGESEQGHERYALASHEDVQTKREMVEVINEFWMQLGIETGQSRMSGGSCAL